MAEEQKNPEEEQSTVEDVTETIEETADEVQASVEDAVSSDDDADDLGDKVEDALEDAEDKLEEISDKVEDKIEEIADKVEDAVEGTVERVAAIVKGDDNHSDATHAHGHADHHYSDEVVLPYFGHIGTMPGGIYTFIFIVLGGLTVIEVAITLIGENAFTITLLVLLSLMKAVLVIMYYMHLKDDNPLYRWVVILPLIIVLLSTLYLLGVPAGAGLGYS